jgi:hypothetical protein
MGEKPMEIDQITLICNGCRSERVFYPDVPIVGAEQLIQWIKTKPTPCSCGARTCDAKCRLKEEKS